MNTLRHHPHICCTPRFSAIVLSFWALLALIGLMVSVPHTSLWLATAQAETTATVTPTSVQVKNTSAQQQQCRTPQGAFTTKDTDKQRTPFSLGVLPDTQFYSRYTTPETGNLFKKRYGSEPYETQTSWLVEHKDELNIPFTVHLGDVVDQAEKSKQWEVADRAMQVMENAGMNYSILPGNHDLIEDDELHDENAQAYAITDPKAAPYRTYFTPERAKKQPTFQERFSSGNLDSEYHIFNGGGQDFLVLALGWRADKPTLEWAQKVIDKHPCLPVILTSHEISNIDAKDKIYLSDDYGAPVIWPELIDKNDQIFLTLSGHHHGSGYMVKKNSFGHDVINILHDYQMDYEGGNGILGLLEFRPQNNELEMTTFSPWVLKKDPKTLTEYDRVLLEDKNDSYTVKLDFNSRLGERKSTGETSSAQDSSSQKLRAILADGQKERSKTVVEQPHDNTDYPKNDATLIHWRPGQITSTSGSLKDGEKLAPGATIPDVQSGQNLVLKGHSKKAQVRFSTDHHPASSDTGSIVFESTDDSSAENPLTEDENPQIPFFATADDAPINSETFAQGYTIEAFVKIDKDFNPDHDDWMSALARGGKRSTVDSFRSDKESDPEDQEEMGKEPPAALSVSNLRQLQWASVPTNKPNEGASNWSHQAEKNTWMHVAIVNDPQKQTVEMFINGAPMIRDVIDATGLATAQKNWIVGASLFDGLIDKGWHGAIGEIRISGKPIPPEQWLTARSASASENTPVSEAESAENTESNTSEEGAISNLAERLGIPPAVLILLPLGIIILVLILLFMKKRR